MQMGLWDPGEEFGRLRWDSRGNRYLDRLSKTSACCSSPSLPISMFSCLGFGCPHLAPVFLWIYLGGL